ncbi:MAG TPA: lipoprotein insertase outer membrane protein LolB [Pseudomonadales bacterium]|nr:lipoprotein insertase outer membrane protein LolB [Pseudomonadales bacterium]HNC70050.1 lipoprotein insertase outer membrane protein LolB [Pseudomonadales bacterium]
MSALRGHLLLALLMLTGCSIAPRAPEMPADWEQHVATLAARENWKLSGKLGVRAQSANGAATLDWTQHGASWRLILAGALGSGRLTLDGGTDGVAWRDTRGRSGHHADPDALVTELWGWPLPVAALRYWVRGIPQPGVAIEKPEFGNGSLRRFVQAGWQIEASEQREVEGFALPTRLRITGYGAVLTLVVREWSLPAS